MHEEPNPVRKMRRLKKMVNNNDDDCDNNNYGSTSPNINGSKQEVESTDTIAYKRPQVVSPYL